MSLLGKRASAEKRAYWASQIQGWEQSNLSQKEFCHQSNVKHSNFLKWRQRLKKQQEEAPENSAQLIPVKIKSVAEESTQHHQVITIDFGSGKRVKLPLTLDVRQLQAVFKCLGLCND